MAAPTTPKTSNNTVTSKRGVGRPRVAKPSSETPLTPKRPVGRPRKSTPTVPTTSTRTPFETQLFKVVAIQAQIIKNGEHVRNRLNWNLRLTPLAAQTPLVKKLLSIISHQAKIILDGQHLLMATRVSMLQAQLLNAQAKLAAALRHG